VADDARATIERIVIAVVAVDLAVNDLGEFGGCGALPGALLKVALVDLERAIAVGAVGRQESPGDIARDRCRCLGGVIS
jgi:hypothetical protein